MKYILLFAFAFVFCTAKSQDATPKSISQQLGLYVFPGEDQDKATQTEDETYCYNWAKENSGVDPQNLPQVEAAQVNTGPNGAAIKGAAKGAAAGAAIGAIAGDSGEGAAIGAVAGGLRARRGSKKQAQAQQQQNNAAAEAKEKEFVEEFNKAFSACMQGKGYTVQ